MGKKRKEMNKSQPHPRVYSITRTTSTIFQIGKNTKMVEKREKEKRKRKKVKKSYLEGTPNTCFSVQILTWYQLLDQDNEHFWTQGQKHLPGMREMQTAYPVLWDQVIISEIPTHKVHPCFCEQVRDTEQKASQTPSEPPSASFRRVPHPQGRIPRAEAAHLLNSHLKGSPYKCSP